MLRAAAPRCRRSTTFRGAVHVPHRPTPRMISSSIQAPRTAQVNAFHHHPHNQARAQRPPPSSLSLSLALVPRRYQTTPSPSSPPPQKSENPSPPHDDDIELVPLVPEARMASWAGLLPFVASAAASVYLPTLGNWGLQWSHYIMWLQMSYGACVLAFLGAVHWGLALAPSAKARRARVLWSMIPAVWATLAQAVPPLYGAPILMLGFVAALVADSRAHRAGLLPDWYLRLRIPITTGVILCLGTSFVSLL